jgi:hypothetical protein
VSEGAAPGLGDISDAAPHLGLARHAQPDPILYTPWVSKMSVARMTALASPPARSGRPFLDAFLPNFEGIFEGLRHARNGAVNGLTYWKIRTWDGYSAPSCGVSFVGIFRGPPWGNPGRPQGQVERIWAAGRPHLAPPPT